MATSITALLAAGAVALGAADTGSPDGHTAIVIDASLARDGRELVDPRLEDTDAEVRIPRTGAEARTNVRYFTELGYRVVAAGPQASAAAETAGASTETASSLSGALSAAR